jgi:hypothetical protein
MTVIFVKHAVALLLRTEQEAGTEIIALIVWLAFMWMIFQEIVRQIVMLLWSRSAYGLEKTENGRLFIGVPAADT